MSKKHNDPRQSIYARFFGEFEIWIWIRDFFCEWYPSNPNLITNIPFLQSWQDMMDIRPGKSPKLIAAVSNIYNTAFRDRINEVK